MAIRIVSYDTDSIPSGERFIVLDGNNPIRFDSLDELKQEIINCCGDVKSIVLDNRARINNLEDSGIQDNFIKGLELSTIRKEVVNSTYIEVQYGRRTISNVLVYRQIENDINEKVYEEYTSNVSIRYHEKYNNGQLFEKFVVIESNTPFTGYVLVL